jgi:hypothetical protein
MSRVYACRFVISTIVMLGWKAWAPKQKILNIRVQFCNFSPIFFFHLLHTFMLFPIPFLREVLFYFPMFFFPGASLDQFTKSTSWEQYNLAKGTIFLVMKSLRGLADVTGFAGRIFAKLEKGHFVSTLIPTPSLSGRASPATPMIPYPLSGPAQILMCFLNPLSSINRPFPPNGVFLRLCDKKKNGGMHKC